MVLRFALSGKVDKMRIDQVRIGLRWVAVGVSATLAACGSGTTKPPSPDAGADAHVPIDAAVAVDAPIAPDLTADTIDVMPDVELMHDSGIPCSDAGECAAPLSCCGGLCVNTTQDPRNCGACGTTCGNTQFCTGTACSETVFPSVCDNPNATVVKDPYDIDNMAAAAIAEALKAACMPPPMILAQDQSDVGVLDPAGRPLAGGSTSYITGGGPFGQHAVAYLDMAGLTPVYLTAEGENFEFRNRLTAQNVVTAPRTTLTDSHDFFLVEVTAEPMSGTLSLAAMGLFAPGTTAAGFWVSSEMIPKRSMYPDRWYVFEWTDSGDKLPNAADTFRLVDHGR
jgi:hypothetical protein